MQILFRLSLLIFLILELNSRIIKKIMKELSVIYARLIIHIKWKNHTLFSASFYKINEEDQKKIEIEKFIELSKWS